MKIKLLVTGGNAKPGPALSQQLGPLGINLGKLIGEVNKASEKYKGMKVPVIVDIDPGTKSFKITVKRPPTAELVKKELALDKGAGDAKIKVGNIAIEQIIKIAKEKQDDMLVNSFREAVKNVIATCTSVGVLVEGKEPKEVIQLINNGQFSELIEKQVTEVSLEKKQKIESQFEEAKAVIEKKKEAEEAEKAAEEAKKEKKEEPEEEEKEAEEAEKPGEKKESQEKKPAKVKEVKEQKGKK